MVEEEEQTSPVRGPDAPFGVAGLVAASMFTTVLMGVWWLALRIAHCGIDAAGGPPPPPGPSQFGQGNLAYAAAGAIIVSAPLLLCWAFTDAEKLRTVALRLALAPILFIAFLTVRELTGGAGYWTSTC